VERILECVPNFSEGRNKSTIDAIVQAMAAIDGVKVLHTDMGYDANRTVVTMAGVPEAVVEAAFSGIAIAADLIDMRHQQGEHPRMGATDVCPLVPVKGITMQEAADLSLKLAKRVGKELQIPVYLYEQSQALPYRRPLQDIRRGEYEGWRNKIADPRWQPDFGPALFNEKSGCVAIGARHFLIAWNINLATKDEQLARQIAGKLRGSGTAKGGIRHPGLFPTLKAIGWYMPAFQCAQVSTNITDCSATPMHEIYEAAKQAAVVHGTSVTGSELVGLVPLEALLVAGRFYGKPEDNEDQLVLAAVHGLGLNEVKPFDPKTNILEYRMKMNK
jgi:glutamate formiminotransferase